MHSTLKRVLFLWMASAAMVPAIVAQMASAIPPHRKLVRLFNGKDFTGFDILLQSKGLNNDTDKIFQVGKGIIHVSGNDFGGIVTQKEYENYYLRAQFKWGEKTWPPRTNETIPGRKSPSITGDPEHYSTRSNRARPWIYFSPRRRSKWTRCKLRD